MAEPEQSAERRTLARRQALTVLGVAQSTASYAAGRLADGLGPEDARRAVWEAAAGLESAAAVLRRLALAPLYLDPAARRALAVALAESGVPQREIAAQVGRARRTVRGWLAGRP